MYAIFARTLFQYLIKLETGTNLAVFSIDGKTTETKET